MSGSRLFIYDPETNSAVCIAKGYSCGWWTSIRYLDEWFDDHQEFNLPESTRFQLKTEFDMPNDASITFEATNQSPKGTEGGDAGTVKK